MTDEDRINWLAELAKRSSTGISIEFVQGGGFRFMSRHKLDAFHTNLRDAIDNAILLRQPPPPSRPPGEMDHD